MCEQKSNKILLQIINKNKTKIWEKKVSKTCVEHIKNNGEFYLYLYLLGT
jgi:hypothetical protein